MHRHALVALILVGCYQPPDLPLMDKVPIVGQAQVCDQQRDAPVACVIDGDTLDVRACGEGAGERIRLLGVSAPEIAHNSSEVSECWGEQASDALRSLVEGKWITLTFDVDCTGLYGRTLAYAWLVGDDLRHLANDPDFQDYARPMRAGDEEYAILVNEWLVLKGHARVFEPEIFGELLYQQRLESAQRRAQQQGRGLWGACEPEGG